MGAISAALQSCQARIRAGCERAERTTGRDQPCAVLLAVSKTFPDTAIREAWLAGQLRFGESYLQEALGKMQTLADLPIEWHFIGPVQSNKTRAIAENFSWVHAVEREKVAMRLSQQRPPELPPLQVCIQVNISGELSKHGIAPERAVPLALTVAALPNLKLRGFMGIPEPSTDKALLLSRFQVLQALLEQARDAGLNLDTLSMGMSGDMETAIAAGSTLVRVGTAIFGARQYLTEALA